MKPFGVQLLLLTTVLLRSLAAGRPELPPLPPQEPFRFVVLGDNRGDDSGQQPPSFLEVLEAVARQAPAFVLDTGDMIYGHTSDETRVRQEWRMYEQAVRRLQIPVFHAPGNHDIWDETSSRIYRELWGNPYYAFDHGDARFIALDTESGNGRLGEMQFRWLRQQLETANHREVFIFFHRPVFPTDGAVGSSLDEYPAEQRRLHQLLVKHRAMIRGVFAGHEHLYSYEPRDGVPYYISGGAGAPLYTAPELGGFHHFLVVQVASNRTEIGLHRVGAPSRRLASPQTVTPPLVLESWKQGQLWYAWDRTANVELTPTAANEERHGLRLNFDLNQYAWPTLVLPFAKPRNLSLYASLALDVYVPPDLPGSFIVTPAVETSKKLTAEPVKLKPGWNTVLTKLDGSWLPGRERAGVNTLEWSLSSEGNTTAGYVVFDNLRATRDDAAGRKQTEVWESFERPLLWRVFDESVPAEIVPANRPGLSQGLRLELDFAKCPRPIAFAQLNPPRALTKVKALVLTLAADTALEHELVIELCLRAKDVEYRTPPTALARGQRQVRFELNESWLPASARAAVEQIGIRLSSKSSATSGTLTLEKLSAAGDS